MFELPKLKYDLDSLSPIMSGDTMRLHYGKHHQTYVNNFNKALDQAGINTGSVEDILRNVDTIPADYRESIRNNGGGHYNHSLFWQVMTPGGTTLADGDLKDKLIDRYQSLDNFYDQFNNAAKSLFGSGWVWLLPDLSIMKTSNQDCPLMPDIADGVEPLLGLDVWEHAYYLDYRNDRGSYANSWWGLIDWDFVNERYQRISSNSKQ